ncbi:MAG: DUF4296 domain-containing protein [Tannerellaceae bacterium]|nr:DUF4296 domain-containing protein [Tannerellaceae bacterium]
MQIAEAMVNIDYKTYQDSGYKESLYESVFRKHKITQETYDSSLVWYGKNLDIYMAIYDRIRKDLDQRITDLGDIQASAAPTAKNDSVDIWPRRPYLAFSPEAFFNGVVFDIKPERNYSSGSNFVLGLRVWGLNPNMKQRPEIRLSVEQGDTILTVNNTITKDGYYETRLQSLPTRQVKRVFGYIRLDNAGNDYYKVYADSLNLMRYNYRADFSLPADTTTVNATQEPLLTR